MSPTKSKKKPIPAGEKAALAHSSAGVCYNPICNEPLIAKRMNHSVINYEIAHIRDEIRPPRSSSGIGWRYWPEDDLTHDERNKHNNLILLCKPCHKIIDKTDPKSYPVSLLKEWKYATENRKSESILKQTGDSVVDEEMLERIVTEAINNVHSDQPANVAVTFKVGMLNEVYIDGSYESVFTPYLIRVNQFKLCGNIKLDIVNKSPFPITINYVGLHFEDNSTIRLQIREEKRILSRDNLSINGLTSDFQSHDIFDPLCRPMGFIATTICGQKAYDNSELVQIYLQYLKTGIWKS